jgi:hypothetical protein
MDVRSGMFFQARRFNTAFLRRQLGLYKHFTNGVKELLHGPRHNPSQVLHDAAAVHKVNIHVKEAPAESENDRVTSVQIQVLDFKAMNGFVVERQQRLRSHRSDGLLFNPASTLTFFVFLASLLR